MASVWSCFGDKTREGGGAGGRERVLVLGALFFCFNALPWPDPVTPATSAHRFPPRCSAA